MVRGRKSTKKFKILTALSVGLIVIGIGLWLFISHTQAFTGNNGSLAFADGSTTSSSNRGRISGQAYSFGSPGTVAARFRLPQVANSAVQFVQNKASPVRNEKMIGYELANGSLYVATCTATCTAQSNLIAQWNTTITSSMTVSTVTRAFDVAYEQQTGRAMVVYAGNTTGKLYYCIWDGTSWGPVSNCAPTNGTNDISLTDGTTTLGTPSWVKLSAYGAQFTENRSNSILLAVQDTSGKLFSISWNGSSWNTSDRVVATTTGGGTVSTTDGGTVPGASFDVGWETNSAQEMLMYASSTAIAYRTSTGSGWSAGTNIQTGLSAAPTWVSVASDPHSNRLSMIMLFGSTITARQYIWKTDGSTVGWTTPASGGNDLTVTNASNSISTCWLKSAGGTATALFSSSANATTPDWSSWTQSGGFVAWAAVPGGTGGGTVDTIIGTELTPSPNSDIVFMMQEDRDGKLKGRAYDGSNWGASVIVTNMSTTVVNTLTGESSNRTVSTQRPWQYAYKPYSPWTLNWQVFDSAGSTSLANQDTEPTVAASAIVHLRVNVEELGGQGETTDTNGVRKKLQFSTGAGCPDSTSCTWTDVAAAGSTSQPWRYSTSGGTTDATTISALELTGSDTLGLNYTNGTATVSGDVQATGTTKEYDYTLQNYSGTVGSDYYFRLYNYGASTSGGSMTNLGPVFREQIANTSGIQNTDCANGSSNINCTYPTLLAYSSAPNPPVFQSVPNGTTTPSISLNSVDILGNGLQYAIEWCPSNSWPCPGGGGSFDQTSSQTGWSGQDITCNGSPCYTGGTTSATSTIATYTVPSGIFQANTTYYLRARSIDPPPGLNAFGLYSSTTSLSTGALNVMIRGGTCIGKTGSGTVCPAQTNQSIGNIKIGN